MTLPDRICDPHHHFWKRTDKEYLPTDLRDDVASVPSVASTVYIECGSWYRESGPEHLRVVGETEWVVANADPLTEGIVGTADLRHDSVRETLDAHIEAGQRRFRGIRQRVTWDASPLIRVAGPDPGPSIMLDPAFRQGIAVLTELGLSFDAWMYFRQLPELTDLARAFPDTTFILNHLGGPIVMGPYTDRAAVLDEWRPLIAEAATCPNIVMKLGGIGMPIYGATWHKQPSPPTAADIALTWRDPIMWCTEAFGVDRCMFESNFPVDRLSTDYAMLWESFDLMSADFSVDERRALFYGTAVRTYRLTEGGN